MNVAIITGASSGIGKEFAKQMDPYFNNVDEFWLIARSEDKLKALSEGLRHKTRIFPIDITDKEKLALLEKTAIKNNVVVRMLINCAGYGVLGTFCEQENDAELGMIRLNCEALTDMTHRMIPFMRWGSRIIQIASSAAFLPQQDFAVYAATKSYVLSFSRALRAELKGSGIYVTTVCPGPVNTPFFEIAEATGSSMSIKKYTMVTVDKVVALALKDSYYKRSISVCSFLMKAFFVLTKVTPHGVLMSITGLLKKGM